MRNLSKKVSWSQGQEWGVNEKKKSSKDTAIISKYKKNIQENVPTHNHYT